MNKLYCSVFVFFVIFCIFFISCSPTIYPALSWQNSKVTIDGKMDEWSNPLRFYDSKSKINYAVTHDSINLYFCLKISDFNTQMRIMQDGLEIMIDTSGKKNFPIILKYPIPNNSRVNTESIQAADPQSVYANPKQYFLNLIKDIEVKGFKYPVFGTIPFNNPFGILASVNSDQAGIMVYEVVIPFSTFYKDKITLGDTTKAFGYKIHINEIQNPEESKTDTQQDDRNNIVGKAGANNALYNGNGGVNADLEQRYKENKFAPIKESMDIYFKMRFSFK